jgi:hypothetical protein
MASPKQPSDTEEALPVEMGEELSIEYFSDVISLSWDARKKWYFIGVRLSMPVSELDVIEKNKNDIDEQFRNMIKKWLEMGGKGCTWKAVYDALRHHTVGHNSIAEELKKTLPSIHKDTCRKRKAALQDSVQAKKAKLDESTITVRNGPECPSVSYGAAAATKDCAYFASGFKVHEFDLISKYWREFECPQESAGLAVVENELFLVGGLDKSGVPTNKVACFSLEKKTWEEKFPPMSTPRANPQVVIAGAYLIALSGKVNEGNSNPTLSVEVLNREKQCWYTNDNISLPEELKYMKWLSACICDKDIYVAARYDDPDFCNTMSKFVNKVVDSDSEWFDEKEYFGDIDPGPYPCYSLFRCPVGVLIEAAEEVKSESKKNLWQRIEHPHPSVYRNADEKLSKHNAHIFYSLQSPEEADPYEVLDDLRTEYNCYGVCRFTLCCINDRLIAVGCKHVESISHENLNDTLIYAYQSYREVNKDLFLNRGHTNIQVYVDYETIDEECHIYVYNTEEDSWKRVKSTPRNGISAEQPSVAVIDNKLVVVRNSKTVHVVTFT